MLQIKDISKKYITGDLHQTALDKVSLNLRDGKITDDSDPCTVDSSKLAEPEHKNMGHASRFSTPYWCGKF